jgi:predicted transcriptional regulator YdeE
MIDEEDRMKSGASGRVLHRKSSALALAVTLVLMAAQRLQAQGGTLRPQIVERDGFTVIGIEIRTSNAEAATTIPREWDRFFKEGIPGKTPNRADADFVVVYSGYASDHYGDYDYLIGSRVRDGSAAPEGMVVKQAPKARYAVVTTARGPVGKVVSEAWRSIWSLEQSGGLGGRRTYKADFEVYDQRSRDPNNSQVDIYVGVE